MEHVVASLLAEWDGTHHNSGSGSGSGSCEPLPLLILLPLVVKVAVVAAVQVPDHRVVPLVILSFSQALRQQQTRNDW